MAHPDHDQVIGRLVGARLRAVTARPSGAGSAEVHPDAETWAAYVDSGLRADDVLRLETHLAGCSACRRLVAALVPEVAAAVMPAGRPAETPGAERGAVIPFPRRPVFAWMAVAAGAFMAVTLWSVSRLGGDRPVAEVAQSRPASAPATPPQAAGSAAPASPAAMPRPQEQDRARADRTVDTPLRQRRSDERALGIAPRQDQDKAAGAGAAAPPALADRGAPPSDRFAATAKVSEQKRTAEAPTPAVNARDVQLQTNTAVAAAKPHGPSANQQANYQQAAAPQPPVPQTAAAPAATAPSAAPLPATPVAVVAAGAAPPSAPVATDAAAAGNERSGLEESVSITTSPGARRAATRAERRRQAADAEREARSKDEAAKEAVVGSQAAAAPPIFAEPGGRLQWRIAGGRRLESSSDGGTTWKPRFTARGRLSAGSAPSIDSAWVVGEHGLVVRFAVPGDWSVVSRPADTTLVAVAASGAQSARVTAADGRVFETADGGATWTATGGVGPP